MNKPTQHDWLDESDADDVHLDSRAAAAKLADQGFRDGIDVGKEATMQTGFNLGFAQGMEAGGKWGEERGFIACREALDVSSSSTTTMPSVEDAKALCKHLIHASPPLDLIRNNAELQRAFGDGDGRNDGANTVK